MKTPTIVCLAGVLLCRAATPAFAASCDSLAAIALKGTTITGAHVVPAGQFSLPSERPTAGRGANPYASLSEFCRVSATLRPSNDSDIKVEVWLPTSGWNGRFQAVGQGGLAGSIPYPELAAALSAGYATAGTDTGHVGDSAEFALGHPEKLVDFAYRAMHEMAVKAKAIVAAHYDRPASHSYFNGCSGGGRHAITSAQRFPADFDGIVAGASSWNQPRMDAARIAVNRIVNRSPESGLPPGKFPMIHAAVLQACDAQQPDVAAIRRETRAVERHVHDQPP